MTESEWLKNTFITFGTAMYFFFAFGWINAPGRVWAEEFGTYFLVETEKAYYIVVKTEKDKYVPAQGFSKEAYSLEEVLEEFHDFVRV